MRVEATMPKLTNVRRDARHDDELIGWLRWSCVSVIRWDEKTVSERDATLSSYRRA